MFAQATSAMHSLIFLAGCLSEAAEQYHGAPWVNRYVNARNRLSIIVTGAVRLGRLGLCGRC